MAVSEGLLAAADTTDNPNVVAWALLACGFAFAGTPIPSPRYEITPPRPDDPSKKR